MIREENVVCAWWRVTTNITSLAACFDSSLPGNIPYEDSHRSAGLIWILSLGCTKALSHPEAPCVSSKRVTVCRLAFPLWSVCLSGLAESSLSGATHCSEWRQCYLFTLSPVVLSLSLSLPFWVRLLAPAQNSNQPASSRTPPSFYFSMPSLLLIVSTSWSNKGMKEGGRWCVGKRRQSGPISALPISVL